MTTQGCFSNTAFEHYSDYASDFDDPWPLPCWVFGVFLPPKTSHLRPSVPVFEPPLLKAHPVSQTSLTVWATCRIFWVKRKKFATKLELGVGECAQIFQVMDKNREDFQASHLGKNNEDPVNSNNHKEKNKQKKVSAGS